MATTPPSTRRAPTWELEGPWFRPTRQRLEANASAFAEFQGTDYLIELQLLDTKADSPSPKIHLSRLATAEAPLRNLAVGPFCEASSRRVVLQETRESFDIIRSYLYCQPIDMRTVSPGFAFVADRWGLKDLFEACFLCAESSILRQRESHDDSLKRFFFTFLPIVAQLDVPARFKRYFSSRLALDLDPTEEEVSRFLFPNIFEDFDKQEPQRKRRRIEALGQDRDGASDRETIVPEFSAQNRAVTEEVPVSSEHASIALPDAPERGKRTKGGTGDLSGRPGKIQSEGRTQPRASSINTDMRRCSTSKTVQKGENLVEECRETTDKHHVTNLINSTTPEEDHSSAIMRYQGRAFWMILRSKRMLLGFVRHMVYGRSTFFSQDVLNVIMTELESQMTDAEVVAVLKEFDWQGACSSAIESETANRWSRRAWRLLACTFVMDERRVGTPVFARCQYPKAGQALRSTEAIQETWEIKDVNGFDLSIEMLRGRIAPGCTEHAFITTVVKPVQKPAHPKQKENPLNSSEVYLRLDVVQDGCRCGLDEEDKASWFNCRPKFRGSYRVGSKYVMGTWRFAHCSIERWVKRHSENCGLMFSISFFIADPDSALRKVSEDGVTFLGVQ